jgi:hypothetical protein
MADAHVRVADTTLRRLRELGFVEQLPTGWRQSRGVDNAP